MTLPHKKNWHHLIVVWLNHLLVFDILNYQLEIRPQKTTGLLGLNPGKASIRGLAASQIVSPTFVSDKIFIPVVIKPISPAFNSLISVALGVNTPTFSTNIFLISRHHFYFHIFINFSINYSY